MSSRTDEEILMDLLDRGIDPGVHAGSWKDLADLLGGLDAIGRDGASALVKIDGERTNGEVYTVVVSGGPLGPGVYFRKDGPDLRKLLRDALSFYASHARRPR